ncbi:ribosome biogenesis GTPase Der [Thiohalorhabdus methylotrophus]|uniref:GTPase Der n=1 Tax=Thiohalorhabdus methylotrophus TaxID=3242694 RepID=A0ABV4TUB8_9GAMM
MKPIVALVGRPNVGKSTLFNRLTRTRDALVSDTPGVTRDRIYGACDYGQRDFILVDTGGLESDVEGGLELLAVEQTRQAIQDAELVVFLVDGRLGLHPEDAGIAEELRRMQVPVLLVVNKSEDLDPGVVGADFYALGFGTPLTISAAANQGMGRMVDLVEERLPPADEEAEALPGIRVAVVGRPNVGKSTLVNALLGEPRMIVYDRPGTTRDAIHTVLERDGQTYTLIDTAGVRRRSRIKETLEKFSTLKAIQAMEAADVVFLLVDAHEGVTDQDARLARLVRDAGRGVVLAVNKWDHLDDQQRHRLRRTLDIKLVPLLYYAPLRYISARYGTGVGHLFEAAETIYTSYTRELSTAELNRVLHEATEAHPPPVRGGFRPKLRYAHQGAKRPPTVVIHGSRPNTLPDNYLRYLERTFQKAFELEGVPLRLQFRKQESPYKGRARHKEAPKSFRGKKGKKKAK